MIHRSDAMSLALILISVVGSSRLALASSVQQVTNRSESEWKDLSVKSPADFLRDENLYAQVYQSQMGQCSRAISDQYRDHPDYMKNLREQQKEFQDQCHAQCKMGDSSGSASCGHSEMNGYETVKAACERQKVVCQLEKDPAIAQHPLQCGCDDLCEDPEILNIKEAATNCADGFIGVYKEFASLASKAVNAVISVAAYSEPSADSGGTGANSNDTSVSDTYSSAMEGVSNWWRSTFDTSSNMKKQVAELIRMKRNLQSCRLASDHALDRDYIAVKVDNLAMACTSRSYRAQQAADVGASLGCSMLAPLPPIFAIANRARLALGVEKFYKNASAISKTLIDQVFRAGVSPSLKEVQGIAKLAKTGEVSEAEALLNGADQAETERALEEMASKCGGRSVSWIAWWIPSAYAGISCELGVLRETLGSHADQAPQLAASDEQKSLEAQASLARGAAMDTGKAGFNEVAGEKSLAAEAAKLKDMTEGGAVVEGSLAVAEQAQKTAEAASNTLQGLNTTKDGSTQAQQLYKTAGKNYLGVAHDLANGSDGPALLKKSPELAQKVASTYWQAADQYVRAGNYSQAETMVEEYASYSGKDPSQAWNEFLNHARTQASNAASSSGFQSGRNLASINQAKDYSSFLKAQKADDGGVASEVRQKLDSYQRQVEQTKPDVLHGNLIRSKSDAYSAKWDYQKKLQQYEARIKNDGDAYRNSAAGKAEQQALRTLEDRYDHARDVYNSQRERFLNSLNPQERSQEAQYNEEMTGP